MLCWELGRVLGSEQQATFIGLCILEPNRVGLDVLVILAREGMHTERGSTYGIYRRPHTYIYIYIIYSVVNVHTYIGPALRR